MGQFQNVQRGILFTFFIYSCVIFANLLIKLIKNKEDDDGDKYKEGGQNKDKKQGDKPKQPQVKDTVNKHEQTLQAFDKKPDQQNQPKQDDTFIVKMGKRLNHHVIYHLSMMFPLVLNICTGTSYAFIFFLYFAVEACFVLFNVLKIHLNCVENKVIRAILQNLSYILTFFMWINQWGASTSPVAYTVYRKF